MGAHEPGAFADFGSDTTSFFDPSVSESSNGNGWTDSEPRAGLVDEVDQPADVVESTSVTEVTIESTPDEEHRGVVEPPESTATRPVVAEGDTTEAPRAVLTRVAVSDTGQQMIDDTVSTSPEAGVESAVSGRSGDERSESDELEGAPIAGEFGDPVAVKEERTETVALATSGQWLVGATTTGTDGPTTEPVPLVPPEAPSATASEELPGDHAPTSICTDDVAEAQRTGETSAVALLDEGASSGEPVVVASPPSLSRSFEPSPATLPISALVSWRKRRNARRLRARQVPRLVRHVDPWSVLKVAFLFHLCMWVIFLISGALLWSAAMRSGTVDNLESFLKELLNYTVFEIDGAVLFRAAAVGGLILVLIGTGLAVLLAMIFNLISDLAGGIRLTVVEEETARRRVQL